MYLAAHFAAVSKWNVQRVALKHTFNTWPWHVFITLVQARIAVFSLCCLRYVLPPFIIQISGECRYRLSSMKLEVSPTPNPNLNLPESVNKCKSDIKTYSLMQPCYFNFLMQIWAVLLNSRIRTEAFLHLSATLYRVSYRVNLLS